MKVLSSELLAFSLSTDFTSLPQCPSEFLSSLDALVPGLKQYHNYTALKVLKQLYKWHCWSTSLSPWSCLAILLVQNWNTIMLIDVNDCRTNLIVLEMHLSEEYVAASIHFCPWQNPMQLGINVQGKPFDTPGCRWGVDWTFWNLVKLNYVFRFAQIGSI